MHPLLFAVALAVALGLSAGLARPAVATVEPRCVASVELFDPCPPGCRQLAGWAELQVCVLER